MTLLVLSGDAHGVDIREGEGAEATRSLRRIPTEADRPPVDPAGVDTSVVRGRLFRRASPGTSPNWQNHRSVGTRRAGCPSRRAR